MRIPFLSRRFSRGFTLIEILVVIVILAILMGIAIPVYLAQQRKAQESRTKQYLVSAYRSARLLVPENSQAFPSPAALASNIQADQPQIKIKLGTQASAQTQDEVVVDTSSTPGLITLYSLSASGNLWKLQASATSPFTFTNLGVNASGYSLAISPDTPAGYWRFDDSGAFAAPTAGGTSGNYTIVLTGQPGATTDNDKAISFDGSSARVDFGDAFDYATTLSFSVESWIYPTAVGTPGTIAAKIDASSAANGWWLRMAGNDIAFSRALSGTQESAGTAGSVIPLNTWSYVVASYDGATLRIYVNGVLKAAGPSSLSEPNTTIPFTAGARWASALTPKYSDFFQGRLDEMAIYDSALTCGTTVVGQACSGGSQIANHYSAR